MRRGLAHYTGRGPQHMCGSSDPGMGGLQAVYGTTSEIHEAIRGHMDMCRGPQVQAGAPEGSVGQPGGGSVQECGSRAVCAVLSPQLSVSAMSSRCRSGSH